LFTSEAIKDERLLGMVRNNLKRLNLEEIKNPYISKAKLKNHPFTARFIRSPIHVKIAKYLGIKEEMLATIRERISNEEQFLSIDASTISKDFRIKTEKIKKIKDALILSRRFEIHPKLAAILCQNYDINELSLSNVEDIKEKISNSKITIPKNQYSDKKLKYLQKIAESHNLNRLSFNTVISDLKLKTAFKNYIEERNSIDSTKKGKELGVTLKNLSGKIKSKKKIESLKAYSRLEKLSKNFSLIKELIENNFTSACEITKIPLYRFQNQFKDKASRNELKEIYYRAQSNLAKNITLGSLKTLIPHSSRLDHLVVRRYNQIKKPQLSNLNKEVNEN
jgi:hypothetical protein